LRASQACLRRRREEQTCRCRKRPPSAELQRALAVLPPEFLALGLHFPPLPIPPGLTRRQVLSADSSLATYSTGTVRAQNRRRSCLGFGPFHPQAQSFSPACAAVVYTTPPPQRGKHAQQWGGTFAPYQLCLSGVRF
jgi:hypothetical protein